MEVQGDGFGFDADFQKLNVRNRRRPVSHLCRTGAAPASPTVVKRNDGGLARFHEQFGARSKILVDAVQGGSTDQVDVEISHRFPEAAVSDYHCGGVGDVVVDLGPGENGRRAKEGTTRCSAIAI